MPGLKQTKTIRRTLIANSQFKYTLPMRLLKLKLRNFKGIRDLEIEPNGNSIKLYGANGIGKTTVGDAIMYLLSHKDTLNRAAENFGIKTRETLPDGTLGDPIHNLEHEVEGTFDEIKLGKIYQEKWGTRRGSAKATFENHTVDYFVDDEPVKKGEYEKALYDIIEAEILKMITLPDYFASTLHWQERRKILFKLVGDIDPEEVIEGHPEVAAYVDILDGKTESSRRNILNKRQKDLRKSVDEIPTRIDEATRQLVEIPTDKKENATDMSEYYEAEKEDIEKQKSMIKSGGEIANLNVKLQAIQGEKAELKNDHQARIDEKLVGFRKKVEELQSQNDDALKEYNATKSNVTSQRDVVDTLLMKIKKQQDVLHVIRKEDPPSKPKNTASSPEIECPKCSHTFSLTKETSVDVETQYEEILSDWNKDKALRSEKANELIEGYKKEIAVEQKKLDDLDKTLADASKKKEELKEQIIEAERDLENAKNDIPSVTTLDSFKELVAKEEAILDDVKNENESRKERLDKLDEKIKSINERKKEHESVLFSIENNRKINNRIAELRKELQETQAKLEDVEDDIQVLDDYVRIQAQYVTDRVNDKFEHVTWQLFETQANGGINEICEARYKGDRYNEGLNNAGRVKAGLDIINTLSREFDKQAPVVVDGRESVTHLPDFDLQIINLIVSPDDSTLRVETI